MPINIYQLFVRLFGNKNNYFVFDGIKQINGCGTFNDVNEAALKSLKKLGITHIWLTGIIRHATQTVYSEIGIPNSNPNIVKGKAGSPYAVNDYYDVDPDLAVDPKNRMQEFQELIERIHKQGMKVLIDFIPNHVAREYKSVVKPESVVDLGADDDSTQTFLPNNNFYYIPDEPFRVPEIQNQLPDYHEFPAKATGNDCFRSNPSATDWFETIKLNYGIDFRTGQTYFDPVPDTWHKMFDIASFWLSKGVDGFRVDMAEMVPVPFWRWLIASLHKKYDPLMLAEIYQPHLYAEFFEAGFDYVYDKEGMYALLERIYRYGEAAETLSDSWKALDGIDNKMCRFLENHDEQRVASKQFLGDAFRAKPGFACSALTHPCAVLVYNGQEVGEDGFIATGYSGDDGRATIFDYAIMPMHQKWMNKGRFDEEQMTSEQKSLRKFYAEILNLRLQNKTFSEGSFYDLMWANPWYTDFDPQYNFAFLRYYDEQCCLVVVNFHATEDRNIRVKIPEDALILTKMQLNQNNWQAKDLLNSENVVTFDLKTVAIEGIHVVLKPLQVAVFELKPQQI